MFRLHLSGGHIWHIRATDDLGPLVQELARLMQLTPVNGANGGPQLIFARPNGTSPLLSNRGAPAKMVFENSRQRIWWRPEQQDAVCEVLTEPSGDDVYHTLRMAVQIIHHHNVLRGGFEFHAALVEWERQGVLLAAKGGTGKSTCCRRLPDAWNACCDDDTLVTRDAKQGYMAHPFPTWSQYLGGNDGQTWQTEVAVPVSVICFLEQAEDDGITPISLSEAGLWMYHAVYPVYRRSFDKQLAGGEIRTFKTRLFNNACDMALNIPAYILRVSRTGQFWKVIEGVMTKKAESHFKR